MVIDASERGKRPKIKITHCVFLSTYSICIQCFVLTPVTISNQIDMAKKRGKNNASAQAEGSPRKKRRQADDWCDPRVRGIHRDAIMAEAHSPSSRATCVDCKKRIQKGAPRWGIKYAGNPLSIPVIPLYGSHPMYMWCHAKCGVAFQRMEPAMHEAWKTCHACEDCPPEQGLLRLLCGGLPKDRKIQHHAFHIRCWLGAINAVDDEAAKTQLMVSPSDICNNKHGLSWEDLTPEERTTVGKIWKEYEEK